uniref:Cytochrome c oxidase subunit 2 n=1 Tax=Synura synuroidea TaxID=47573 RepID=Q9MGB5_9STRA|nr:cytochrome c oxidase subunit 2 [Synura synuroidea]AAF36934.1 cytochrome c oxidase subunit 2 [Synura synuroidea]
MQLFYQKFIQFNFYFLIFLLTVNLFSFISFCDASFDWQIGFQDPATPIAEGIILFHNYLMSFIVLICILVFYVLYFIIDSFNSSKVSKASNFTDFNLLEIVWTLFPAIILLFLAIPSFTLLYSLDELIDPDLTLKIIGHQWYWTYEYSDFSSMTNGESINFDSYMVSSNDLIKGGFRLLEVDNRVILPVLTHIRLLITAADVIHCWTVPSFGVKVDACPGRLSQASLFIKREGLYFGQCSEICGVNHGFMPIAVKSVSSDNFLTWVLYKIENI